jgi:hypothetical protein
MVLNRVLPAALASSLVVLCPAAPRAQTLQHRPAHVPAAAEPAPVPAETQPLPPAAKEYVLAAGTTLQVEIDRDYPMKAGKALEGRLVYPLYIDDELAVPAHTLVRGAVSALQPDRKTRWHARLMGDFTPFHVARVQFDQIVVDGSPLPLHTSGAVTGAPVLRLSAPGATPKKSLIAREWDKAKANAHDRIAYFTAPGLGDRAKQVLYHQLPYHPERIPAHTAWTFELAAPVTLPDPPQAAAAAALPATAPGNPEIWSVHALLTAEVTSARAKPGDPVQALVVEPVYDKDRDLVVPQGSTLIGHVTTAKSARSLGRNGKLRFTFQQIRFPQGVGQPTTNRPVEGALGGATTQGATSLTMDAEGTVTPKSQASALAPILLTLLAGRALDNDRDGNLTAQTGVASNGFGLVGRVVGIAAGNRNFAAGLGFYAAGLSAYENFLRAGHDVDFPKDTRIEIETTPLRAPVLKPQGQ